MTMLAVSRIPAIAAALALMIGSACTQPETGPTCGPVDACLVALTDVAAGELGIQPAESAISDQVAKWGQEAVPGLVALLSHPKVGVRNLAGYTLRSIERVDAKYLPALMAAQRRESGWLPVVIARIGTDEALRFLVEELRRDPDGADQVRFGLGRAGAKAVPHVLTLFECGASCDRYLLREAGRVLAELKPEGEREAAVDPLLAIARSDRYSNVARQMAIAALGDLGNSGRAAVARLLELKARAPEFADGIERAVISTGSREAVVILLRKLPVATTGEPLSEGGVTVLSPIPWMDQTEMVIDTIGDLGPTARDAGAKVLPYLRSRALAERVAAADALGRIGYREGRDALRQALNDPVDWRLVHQASEALGRLGDEAALEDLDRTAREHWFPRVREAAGRSADHIRSGRALATDETRRVLRWADMESCAVSPPQWTEPAGLGRKWTLPRDAAQLQQLRYATQAIGFAPVAGTKPNRHGIIHLRPENMEMKVEEVTEVPRVAVEIEDGWLLGGHRGEFGGELVHRGNDGRIALLLDDNVEGIFRLGEAWVVSAGLSHGRSTGAIYRVERGSDGHWAARPWRRLPGAPRESWLLDARRLYVDTYGGGSIVVHADGRMEMAHCATR